MAASRTEVLTKIDGLKSRHEVWRSENLKTAEKEIDDVILNPNSWARMTSVEIDLSKFEFDESSLDKLEAAYRAVGWSRIIIYRGSFAVAGACRIEFWLE